MIIKKVRGKNFLSIGNAFLEYDVQKYKRTVIGGKNGSAKSSIANLITFGLFGQAIKNISKPQIVNSINAKHCVVEIEFESNGKQFLIRRGIKPNIFEIIEDGVHLDQTLASDFQEYLEKNILKTNLKTFLQTSILSVENYKPFMTLRTHERRAFIEEILDIKVFSFMNQILKTKTTKLKEELKLLDVEITSAFSMAKIQKSHIDKIESIKDENVLQLKQKNEELTSEKEELQKRNSEVSAAIKIHVDSLVKLNTKSKEHQMVLTKLDELESILEETEAKHKILSEDAICPTCNSDIREDSKSELLDPLHAKILDCKNKKTILIKKLPEYESLSEQIADLNQTIQILNSEVSTNNAVISRLESDIDKLSSETSILTKIEELAEMKAELKQAATNALNLKQKKADLLQEQQYNEMMLELFKDSGIKSKIVEQYIPIINSLINSYLEKMDFFVSFNLDSEFNEIIKSRHRDDFTYGSFSAGERTKIDIALLFTFRQLSKIKNSFDCNLLFIDEILEFLDEAGTECFLSMIEELDEFKNSNICIISHKLKDRLAEVFDGCVMMHKESGFSLMTDLSK